MILILIFLPLLNFFNCLLFGRLIGIKGSKIISCLILFLTFFLSLIIFKEIFTYNIEINIIGFNWFNLGLLNCLFCFKIDKIVISMLILVNSISFLVHLYSISYMDGDPHLCRFMSYLSLFTFFMIILVTSNNILQLFIGWEGVGLCSYLLINFWFTRIQANKSAIKAMLINKIGDIGLLLGIIILWDKIGNFNYQTIFCLFSIFNENNITIIIAILLLIGVMGKSAQIGLHMWLPDAMEGPTPVSALIHAATMVTAGVFLIIRLSPLFECLPSILILIILLGSLTAFFSSTIGLMQNDLKKVIAYSTCSQLGYMILICGFSYYNLSLFHLINHGFFKALLFLSAGSIIHSIIDEQDMRKFGGLINFNPITYVCLLIGSLSLMGLPFLTGFYSKDLIIELVYGSFKIKFAFILSIISAFFTAFYSFRLIHYSFNSDIQGNKNNYKFIHESNNIILLSLLILLIMSIISGYLFQNLLLNNFKPPIIPQFYKLLTLILTIIGLFYAIKIGYKYNFYFNIIKISLWHKFYNFINYSWYFDYIINYFIIKPLIVIGFNITYKFIDNQILEKFGPNNIKDKLIIIINNISKIHNGKLFIYIYIIIIFIYFFSIQI
uniref:NADH-ubiquinone oxidoreductase chain 5 n=1 Tax=Pennaria disticha TaxID=264068 RepID=G9ISZ4_9CNID|nr:NADH dehydrogenase subunit 5 [Pennaria disticha]